MRWQYILLGLALVLLAFSSFQSVKNYVPQLEDWNWYMEAVITSHSSYPVLVKFRLPSEVNDLNSLRITSGRGSSEHFVSFWLDDRNNVYVYVKLPAVLRIYWGREGALPVYDRYRRVSFVVNGRGLQVDHKGYVWSRPYTWSSYIYLIRWDRTAHGQLQYARRYPDLPFEERMWIYGNPWGRGALFIPFDDENVNFDLTSWDCNVAHLPFSLTGVLVVTRGDGRFHYYVLSQGTVLKSYSARWGYGLWMRRDSRHVYVFSRGLEGTYSVSSPARYPRLYYSACGGGGAYFQVSGWRVSTIPPARVSRIRFSKVMMAPKRPRVRELLPSGVLSDSNVLVKASVYDPNGDLSRVKLYLNGRLLLDSNRGDLNLPLELNDGVYTLRLVASDCEGASVTQIQSFTVDTHPPEVNVSYELNDGNMDFSFEVNDLTSVTCAYQFEGNVSQFDCNSLVLPVPKKCGEHVARLSFCDEAHNCVYKEYSVRVPCSPGVLVPPAFQQEVKPKVELIRSEVRHVSFSQESSPLVSGEAVRTVSLFSVLALFLFVFLHV